MEKTVCELFAGVGGFRCGLNSIDVIEDTLKPEKWKTVWFSQWEPLDKKVQWAHSCYINRFGSCEDIDGNDTTNFDINTVNKSKIPNHNLLVGGFPCQDYSVATSLASSKGLEGKKGILWWDIRDVLETKEPPFLLLENVDRLLKSPANQRGRDFGIILACLRDLNYTVEWRVINANEYGYQQRRRRTFIFAYKDKTRYYKKIEKMIGSYNTDFFGESKEGIVQIIMEKGFFAQCFPIQAFDTGKVSNIRLPEGLGDLSENFKFNFENSGVMKDGIVYTVKSNPSYYGKQITLGDILETGDVDCDYFIEEDKMYYTYPHISHSDETKERLPVEKRKTWQYIKGAKKLPRKASNGHEYMFSEGPVALFDEYDKPARTMLTSEGTFSRSTHVIKDKKTGKARLLTPIECERIQGFPTDWTKECLVNGEKVEMPINKRRFMMGNALVVNLVKRMEQQLSKIFEEE